MSQAQKISQRELRKRLLRLEAESHRLEMLAIVQELRHPMLPLQHAPILLNLMGNKSAMLATAATYLADKRLGWLVKAIPVALAGWRIAKMVLRLIEKRRSA